MTRQEYSFVIEHIKRFIANTDFEGHVFVVGGCVRDLLLGNPIKDIDLVIDMPNGGIRFAKWMQANGHTIGSVVTYENYGTAMFKIQPFGQEIECVQTRSEEYIDRTSRNPKTQFGTIQEDCMRRDFTVNALYYNISKDEILDLTGRGRKDIKEGIIRTTDNNPDVIFSDDALRQLRACRFASRYGWAIEDKTFEAMKRNAYRLSTISRERIAAELDKMLMCDNVVQAIMLLKESGLLTEFIPQFKDTFDCTQNRYHDYNTVWDHIILVMSNLSYKADLSTRLAALFHDIGKPTVKSIGKDGENHFIMHEFASARMTEDILRTLRYPIATIKEVSKLIKWHMATKSFGNECTNVKPHHIRNIQQHFTPQEFEKLLLLIDADNKSHGKDYVLPEQAQIIETISKKLVDERQDAFGYKLPATGDDIMYVLSIQPGPAVKMITDTCRRWAFKQTLLPNRDQCLDYITKHGKGWLKNYNKNTK